jgi:SAM-dependent methyltransferase
MPSPDVLPQPSPRRCPYCLHPETDRLHAHPMAPISGASLHRGYDVVACRRCGGVFASPLPVQADFDRYYAEQSKYEDPMRLGAPSGVDQRRFAAIAEGLAQALPDPTLRLLDVGCATGGLLSALKQQGFTALSGLDPSPPCAQCARALTSATVHVGSLFEPLPGGPYDVLTAIGVLEHLRDLDGAVPGLASGLVPGGLLYVEVPDLLGFPASTEAPFQEFSTEHVTFFTTRSLDTLLGRFGFQRAFGETVLRSHSGGSRMQVLALAYRKTLAAPPLLERDPGGPVAAEEYVRVSRSRDRPLQTLVSDLVADGQPFAVWGAGTLSCRLMADSRLAEAPIVAFVDSNPHLQGRTLGGRAIHSPAWLRGFQGPIFVASLGHGPAIEASLRTDLALANRIIHPPVPTTNPPVKG